MQNGPGLASFDITPSPHRRINAPSLLLAFAHIHGEAGTPTEGIWNALVGRKSPVLCMCRRVDLFPYDKKDPIILATLDTTPSPHRRINAPSLLLAFAHIHGEAGTPYLGICSAVVGRNGPFLCAEGVDLFPCKTTPFSLHLTPPRLRTGESMHLVYFWPSPTSMARRERQRWASAVQWWVGTVRFYDVQKGWISMQNDPILATFDTTPSPHGRINAPSLLLAFAHIHGEAGTPSLVICSAVQWWVGTVRCFYVQKGWIAKSAKRPHSRHI